MNLMILNARYAYGIAIVTFAIGILFASFSYAYNYGGYRWGGSFPNVIIDQSGISIPAWQNVITGAMNDWNNTGAKFNFTNGASANKITTSYEVTNALAWTNMTRKYGLWGDAVKGSVVMNLYHNFNPPYTSGASYDLRTVMRHEFGHWLILNHTTNSGTLMYPSIGYGQVKNITTDEVSGIKAIYGAR